MLNDERLAPVFAIAAERRVPILIHGGRGLPPIADHLARLVDGYPEAQLIIAHAGIADLAGLAGRFGGRAGVFFDTSVWSAVDLLSFFHLVSPEQVLYASDYPYGRPPSSLMIALRTARVAGFDDDQLRDMLAGKREPDRRGRAAEEADQADRRRGIHPADDDGAHPPVPLDGDAAALDAAARLDRRDRARAQRQPTSATATRARSSTMIRELLTTARDLWRVFPEVEDEDLNEVSRVTRGLVHIADILAVTTRA